MSEVTINRWLMAAVVVMLALIAAAASVFVYLAFIQRISPLESQRLVSVEAISVSGSQTLVVTREFCLSRPAEADAIRILRRIPNGDGGLEDVYEVGPAPVHLRQGCHQRPRTVSVPDIIRPGRYVYQAALRFCNEIRCKTEWLPPVVLVVDSFGGRHALRIEAVPPEIELEKDPRK